MTLKPCPSPGKGCEVTLSTYFHTHYVHCTCGWRGPLSTDRDKAVESWNNREARPNALDTKGPRA